MPTWEDKPTPYTLNWLPDNKYELLYKGNVVGDGMMPANIVQGFVEHMNFAYNDGVKDGIAKTKD